MAQLASICSFCRVNPWTCVGMRESLSLSTHEYMDPPVSFISLIPMPYCFMTGLKSFSSLVFFWPLTASMYSSPLILESTNYQSINNPLNPLRMFKDDSRKIQGKFKENSRKIQGKLKENSRKYRGHHALMAISATNRVNAGITSIPSEPTMLTSLDMGFFS